MSGILRSSRRSPAPFSVAPISVGWRKVWSGTFSTASLSAAVGIAISVSSFSAQSQEASDSQQLPPVVVEAPVQKAAPKKKASAPKKSAPVAAAPVPQPAPVASFNQVGTGGGTGDGGVVGYLATETSTATKTETPLKDIPQSITVVTKEQAKDQGSPRSRQGAHLRARHRHGPGRGPPRCADHPRRQHHGRLLHRRRSRRRPVLSRSLQYRSRRGSEGPECHDLRSRRRRRRDQSRYQEGRRRAPLRGDDHIRFIRYQAGRDRRGSGGDQ